MKFKTTAQSGYDPAPRLAPKLRFCRYDLAVILLVCLLSAGTAFGLYESARKGASEGGNLEAVLTVAGREVWHADLSDDSLPQTYRAPVPGGSLTVLAEKGRVRVAESDCPDQVCVNSGWLTSAGQSAVCIPNRAVLTVRTAGAEDSEQTDIPYDVISR